jgi:undecaprenyl-diphosphatase
LLFEKTIVKSLDERERPYTSIGDEIIVRGGAYEGLSFPSGHSTTAFATATLLFALLPTRWRWLPVVWAVLVGVARMYMGEHNTLDVVCGAAIGTLFAVLIWRFVLERPAIAGAERLPGQLGMSVRIDR